MSLYYIIIKVVRALLYLINGKPIVIGESNWPEKPSIIASTHRSFLDPVYLVILGLPGQISIMAKKSLFEIPIIGYLIDKVNAFPINRDKPSTSAIRHAVKEINQEKRHVGIFPTGSRYETDVKGGTAFIQRMSKTDIIPVAIQPPLSAKEIILRKKAKIAIGKPIAYDPNKKYSKEDLAEIDAKIATEFQRLDAILDLNYEYIPPVKNDRLFTDKREEKK